MKTETVSNEVRIGHQADKYFKRINDGEHYCRLLGHDTVLSGRCGQIVTALTLQMEAVYSAETYTTTQCRNPDDLNMNRWVALHYGILFWTFYQTDQQVEEQNVLCEQLWWVCGHGGHTKKDAKTERIWGTEMKNEEKGKKRRDTGIIKFRNRWTKVINAVSSLSTGSANTSL